MQKRLLILLGALMVTQIISLAASAEENIVISEFLAVKNNGIIDFEGELTDWAEIFNAGTTTVNLLDWYMTDDTEDEKII